MERTVLRVATVAALLNGGSEPYPTLAGPFVYDSMMDTIVDVVPNKRRPTIVVRTDEDMLAFSSHKIVGRQCRLLIEIGVLTASTIKINGQDHERLDWPSTDSALEAFLDLFEWQVWNALRGFSEWARWYRDRAGFGTISAYQSTPRFSAPERGSVRIAVRTLSVMTSLPPDCTLNPVKEYPDGSCVFEPVLPPRWEALVCELQQATSGDFRRSVDELAKMIETYGKMHRPVYPQLQRVWGTLPNLEIEAMWPIEQEAPFCADGLIAGLPVLGEPVGENAYSAPAVHFDGTKLIAANSISTVDNGDFSASFWMKSAGVWGWTTPWVSVPESWYANFFAHSAFGGLFNFWLSSYDPYINLQAHVSEQSTGVWHHFLVSAKTNLGAGLKLLKVYVDDVSVETITADALGSFIPKFDGEPLFIGGDIYEDNLDGDMADFWFAPGVSLLDGGGLIPTATRRKFIDGSGKPVNPSGFPAGGAILFSGDASTFATNQLSGGTLRVAGPPLSANGRNGAGAVTLTGAVAGQPVVHVYDATGEADVSAQFESVISVNGQIQQIGAGDYSAHDCRFFLPSTLTNASSSPSA